MSYASLVILFNDNKQILLLKRSRGVDSFAGMWGFPGGKREDGETSLDAAIREVEEETTLKILPKDLAYIFTMQREPGKDLIFFIAKNWKGNVLIDHESEAYEWRSAKNMQTNDIVPTPKIVFDMIEAWSEMF